MNRDEAIHKMIICAILFILALVGLPVTIFGMFNNVSAVLFP